jgi:hypothetical protein
MCTMLRPQYERGSDHVLECFQHLVRIQAAHQSPARMGQLLVDPTTAILPRHRVLFRLLVLPASIRCMKNMGMWTVPAGHAHLPVRWVSCIHLDQYVTAVSVSKSNKCVAVPQVQPAVVSRSNLHFMLLQHIIYLHSFIHSILFVLCHCRSSVHVWCIF